MLANKEVSKAQLHYPGIYTQDNGKVNCWLAVKWLANKTGKENVKKTKKKPNKKYFAMIEKMVQPTEMKGSRQWLCSHALRDW